MSVGKAVALIVAALVMAGLALMLAVASLFGGATVMTSTCAPAVVAVAAPAAGGRVQPVSDAPIDVTAAAAVSYWTGEAAVEAVAVAGAESGFNPTNENPNSTAKGLWQTMMSIHGVDGTEPKYRPGEKWSDPYANARVAHIIWENAGNTFSGPWVTYDSGAYQFFMTQARAAVQRVLDAGGAGGGAVPAADPGTSGDPNVIDQSGGSSQPPVLEAAAFVREHWGFTGTIGGYASSGHVSNSKHYQGLAMDVMVSPSNTTAQGADKALGDDIAAFFATPDNAAAFGVDNVIWYGKITNAGRGWVWGDYGDHGDDVSNHMEHVHVDFTPEGGTGAPAVPAATTTEDTGCADPTAVNAAATGAVQYPVAIPPAINQDNFGGTGANWSSTHTGTDFSVACGTPVQAATGGTVEIESGPSWYGNWLVKVVTGPNSLATWYAHMQAVSVEDGGTVTAGDVLGEVGALGNATGCHLHFEVHPHNGTIYEDDTDPTPWLAEHVGQPLGGAAGGTTSTGPVPAGEGVLVASYNVLGASHTTGGPGSRRGFQTWDKRLPRVVDLVNQTGVTLVGFQEMQREQHDAFLAQAPGWATWHPSGTTVNAVAWRTDTWTMVAHRSLMVPYFNSDQPMPLVQLQHESGVKVWVLNVHNPADTHGPAQAKRDEAVRREIAALDALNAPALWMGDMNDTTGFYCPATAAGFTPAAPGGSTSPCRVPPDTRIDWIVGTPEVEFSGWTLVRDEAASDHPMAVTAIH